MSVVVAVRKNGKSVIASDTQSTYGSLVMSADKNVNHHKIFELEGAYLGMVGWGAVESIIDHLLQSKKAKFNFDNRVAVFESLLRLQKILKKKYYINTGDGDYQPVESNQMHGLIVNSNFIFEICEDRTVTEIEKFWAIGTGQRYALGAMTAMYDDIDDASEIARRAIHAACEFDTYCGLPMVLHESTSLLDKEPVKKVTKKSIKSPNGRQPRKKTTK